MAYEPKQRLTIMLTAYHAMQNYYRQKNCNNVHVFPSEPPPVDEHSTASSSQHM